MGTTFTQLCYRVSTPYHVDISYDPATDLVPSNLAQQLGVLINIMRPRMRSLDRVTLPFIEAAFEDIHKAEEILDTNTIDGEIPDVIFGVLSDNLYNQHFNNLDDNQQSIIKVLGCYLMLSKK